MSAVIVNPSGKAPVIGQTLRERAKAAYDAAERAADEAELLRQEGERIELAGMLKRVFNISVDVRIEETDETYTVLATYDDITFTSGDNRSTGKRAPFARGICDKCGEPVWVIAESDFGLGFALFGDPIHPEGCPSKEEE